MEDTKSGSKRMPLSVAALMRPLRGVIHVEAPITEALARLEMLDETCLVVVDGDEVVGVLPDHLAQASHRAQTDTSLAAIMLPPTALCTLDDDIDRLRDLLRRLDRTNALVLDEHDQLIGLVDAAQLDTAYPETARREAIESLQAGDPAGGRTLPEPQGELRVYTERPHVKRDRWA